MVGRKARGGHLVEKWEKCLEIVAINESDISDAIKSAGRG
jgi:hypothetical protein